MEFTLRAVYVRDLVKQKTVLASVSSAGEPEGDFSENPVISGNGRYVAFQSSSISSTANGSAVFVHDLQTGSTAEASVSGTGDSAARGSAADPSISSDGRYIVSRQAPRAASASTAAAARPTDWSDNPAVDADGSAVAFLSAATNLVAGDTNGTPGIFVHAG